MPRKDGRVFPVIAAVVLVVMISLCIWYWPAKIAESKARQPTFQDLVQNGCEKAGMNYLSYKIADNSGYVSEVYCEAGSEVRLILVNTKR